MADVLQKVGHPPKKQQFKFGLHHDLVKLFLLIQNTLGEVQNPRFRGV